MKSPARRAGQVRAGAPALCRRCGSEDVRELGRAHSLLDWLVCNECWHVWGIFCVGRRPSTSGRAVADEPRPEGTVLYERRPSLMVTFRSGGEKMRTRVAGVVARVFRRTGAAICLMLASAAFAGAQPAQAPQPAPHGRIFTADGGMVLNFVKPDKTADFEAVMVKLREALQKSDKPERKRQAAGWKVMRAVEPGPGGSVLYVFLIDPVVKDADYTVSTILAEAFPQDVQALYKQYADSYTSGQNFVNLALVSALDR
jgi:hypothetical protein